MFVVEPALAPTAASSAAGLPSSSSSYTAPVHIAIDDSSSDTDEEVVADGQVENGQQEELAEAVAELPQEQSRVALEVETNGGREQSTRLSPILTATEPPSPVSRLNGYAGADATALESTSSSPSRQRNGGAGGLTNHNAEFFKSVREDILQRTPSPMKASLKRPLVLRMGEQRASLQGGQDMTIDSPSPAARNGGGGENAVLKASMRSVYHSSSDSSDAEDDERDDTVASVVKKPKPEPSLNFFMRESQEPFEPDLERIAEQASAAIQQQQSQQQQRTRVCSSKTRICGQVYGRCELHFSDRSVELVLWRQGDPEKRIWQGTLKYAHLQRFCFFNGNRLPPYLLLMEIRASEEVHTLFSEFYDSIFAKFAQERMEAPKPNLYGAAFYFDGQMNFVRCQSMVESFPALRELFAVQIPEEEALEYLDSEVNGDGGSSSRPSTIRTLRERRRSSLVSTLAGGVKSAVNAVSSYFGSSGGQQHSTISASERNGLLSSSRTDKNAAGTTKSGQSIAKFFHRRSEQAVVEIDDPYQASFAGDELEEKEPPSEDAKERASASREESAEDLTVSQVHDDASQAVEANRSSTLLMYPYEESETAGKISVTHGDIARLAPGEFLNDNIIDFYLRFYWRHLEPWRRDQMHFYSSHFFTQLNGNGATLTADERFARVSRWTKETDLFTKKFLFIPINDSFHWSVAVFCNPGSAITMKRRKIRQVVVSKSGKRLARRPISIDSGEPMIVDLEDPFSQFRRANRDEHEHERNDIEEDSDDGCDEVREEFIEEDLQNHEAYRRNNPPCLLFLDSLKCHRKKKFTAMLREYLDSEWKTRHGSESSEAVTTGIDDEPIVSRFDPDAIELLEPEIPMQTNSSDCGVFLLMYAAEVARRFPAGITQEDVETKFSSSLSYDMFDVDHVLEFRDYLQQLIFCLHSLQKRGLSEELVKDEELETFTIDR